MKHFKRNIIIILTVLVLVSISLFIFYRIYPSKTRISYPVIPEGVLEGGFVGNECPLGDKKYDTSSGYPVISRRSINDEKKLREKIYYQMENSDMFKRDSPNHTAEDELVLLSGEYIEKIEVSYSNVGEIDSTEEELRPKLESFLEKFGYNLGNPSYSDFSLTAGDKVYTFSTPMQKIAGYPVKDTIISITFVDNGITRVSGHWWRLEGDVFGSLKVLNKDTLLNNFTYTSIISHGTEVPTPTEHIRDIDKKDILVGNIYIIENSLCSRQNYDSGFFLVYEATVNNSALGWTLYIDATNGEVISIKRFI